jgi:hypothetical protein
MTTTTPTPTPTATTMTVMDRKKKITRKFHKSVLEFLDALIEVLNEPDLFLARLFLDKHQDVVGLLEGFGEQLNEDGGTMKAMVADRSEQFFLKCTLFNGLVGKDRADYFKVIWNSQKMTDENKATFWSWVDLLVTLSDKYVECV